MASAVLLPSGSPVNVKVHPVVIFAVCDAYTRRKENQERVIGSLLGTVAADGTVEVKNCYVVPHTENAETVGTITHLQPGISVLHGPVNRAYLTADFCIMVLRGDYMH